MKIGVVVPCFNEESRLDIASFSEFIENNNDYNFCFVNDGSTDNTLQVITALHHKYPEQVRVVNLEKNSGKAFAVREGMEYLYEYTNDEFIGYIDSDLATGFSDLKRMVSTIKSDDKTQVIFGSRDGLKGDIQRTKMRSFVSAIFHFVIKVLLRLPIKDTQCGAKLFRREIIPTVCASYFKTRWLFDVEIFFRLKTKYGKKAIMNYIHELPLDKWDEVPGSKVNKKDLVRIPVNILKLFYFYKVETSITVLTSLL